MYGWVGEMNETFKLGRGRFRWQKTIISFNMYMSLLLFCLSWLLPLVNFIYYFVAMVAN
jgi:hypothetical protein